MRTYLIAYGNNPNDLLTTQVFTTKRQANVVISQIDPDVHQVRCLVTNPDQIDAALPGRSLIEVYNVLAGENLTRFPRRADGARKVFEILGQVAQEVPSDVSPASSADTTRGRSERVMTETTETSAQSGRPRRFTDTSEARGKGIEVRSDQRIELRCNENPKRGGAAERFALYTNGITVEEAIQRGITKSDLRWDVAHGYIQLMDPQ
jgi:hypothetical protein